MANNTNKVEIDDVSHNHPQVTPRKGSGQRRKHFKAQRKEKKLKNPNERK